MTGLIVSPHLSRCSDGTDADVIAPVLAPKIRCVASVPQRVALDDLMSSTDGCDEFSVWVGSPTEECLSIP